MHKNKNKPGYKKTKVGWIPLDWECRTFGAVFDIQLGKMLSQKARESEGHAPYLANINVRWGGFDLSNVRTMAFSSTERNKFELSDGDLLVCEGGEIGRCAIWHNSITPCYYQKALHRLRPKGEDVSAIFAMSFLHKVVRSPRMRGYIGETSIAHFTRERFISFPIPLPSLPEQEAIAEVLECWDKAIRGVEKKIEKKRKIKTGLMQRLLSGDQRLPEFETAEGAEGRRGGGKNSDGWKEVQLGEIVSIKKGEQLNRMDQGKTGDYPVLNGGVQPLGYTDNWNTEANTITISEGGNSCGFVSMIRACFWCGGHCYTLKEDTSQVDISFLYQQLKHNQSAIMRLRVGSGLPNIQKKTLVKFHLQSPRLEEQRAIAAVLTSADKEIVSLERKLVALREQKRFLLNNLVTGAIRLPQFQPRRPFASSAVGKNKPPRTLSSAEGEDT